MLGNLRNGKNDRSFPLFGEMGLRDRLIDEMSYDPRVLKC